MKFFRVRNFERFQHYHDRRPPWIKLYRDLWDDPRFFELQERERYILIGIFVLASQHENMVTAAQSWLQVKLLTSKPIPLQRLIDTGWIEMVEQTASVRESASDMSADTLADGYPSRAGGETETEIQRQNTETDKKHVVDQRRSGLIESFLTDWQAVKGRKLVTDSSDFAAIDKLLRATTGDDAYSLENLRKAHFLFIRSVDPFVLKQGHPLRYFATNLNAFMGDGNGAHQQNGNQATRSSGIPKYTPKQ